MSGFVTQTWRWQPAELTARVRTFLRTRLNIVLAASSDSPERPEDRARPGGGGGLEGRERGGISGAGGSHPGGGGGGGPEREAHLIARAQSGDRRAFQTLVTTYQSRLFVVVRGMVRNQEDAQDILQDVFIKAYGSLESFRGQSSFYTWLYRVAVNLCIDHRRKVGRRPTTEYDDKIETEGAEGAEVPGASDLSPHRALADKQLGQNIRAAMDALPEDQRTAVVLRELEGLSYKEIADVMRCSQGTVMSRLFYGRKKLQEMLKDLI